MDIPKIKKHSGDLIDSVYLRKVNNTTILKRVKIFVDSRFLRIQRLDYLADFGCKYILEIALSNIENFKFITKEDSSVIPNISELYIDIYNQYSLRSGK